ncbi:MAG: MFS transporter [Armatimonadota bacterium]|nr:MFS transporter [Armatimonadota bacterium]MDR7535930.1 MFS transporter [Armatimonadota bacterium]
MTLPEDRNLRALFAALFLWTFGIGLYEQLVPIFARQLGASPVHLGTLFNLRYLALAGGYLIGILVADRWRRRTVIIASWVSAAPVPLLLAAAPAYVWLLPGLLLYEVTFFGLPAVHAFVAERVTPDRLASTFATLGMMTSTAFLVAPTLGGVVADRWGIRATLLLAAACYAVSTAVVLRVRGAPPAPRRSGPALPMAWPALRPQLPVLLLVAGPAVAVLAAAPFLTPFLREVRGLSLSEIGFLGSMTAVGGVALTAVGGRLGDRLGVTPALAGALLVYALGMTLNVYGPAALLPVASVLRARAPTAALGQALVGARAPGEMLGRAFAISGMLAALLAAAGVVVGGYAYRANPALPLLLSAALVVVLAGAVAWLRPVPALAAAHTQPAGAAREAPAP